MLVDGMSKTIQNEAEFIADFNEAVSSMKEGYIVAMSTDKFDVQCIDSENFERSKLYQMALEIRIFHESAEVKWFRTSIDKEWKCRVINDMQLKEDFEYWDEFQYLDIDTEKTRKMGESGIAYATGGGRYSLPIKKYDEAKVKVRNYLSYEEDTSQLYVSDWRLVKFCNEEE